MARSVPGFQGDWSSWIMNALGRQRRSRALMVYVRCRCPGERDGLCKCSPLMRGQRNRMGCCFPVCWSPMRTLIRHSAGAAIPTSVAPMPERWQPTSENIRAELWRWFKSALSARCTWLGAMVCVLCAPTSTAWDLGPSAAGTPSLKEHLVGKIASRFSRLPWFRWSTGAAQKGNSWRLGWQLPVACSAV